MSLPKDCPRCGEKMQKVINAEHSIQVMWWCISCGKEVMTVCNYPDCKCPFDKTSKDKCWNRLPEINIKRGGEW